MLNLAAFLNDFAFLPRIDFGKIWSFFKVTEESRFKRVRSIRDKDGDPREPTWLGTIYCDQRSDKEYFVVSSIYEEAGQDHREISSIKEIESAVGISHAMTAKELSSALRLKPADVDAEDAMIAYFKRDTEEAGAIFHDLRDRNHTAGTSKAPALTNSLS